MITGIVLTSISACLASFALGWALRGIADASDARERESEDGLG